MKRLTLLALALSIGIPLTACGEHMNHKTDKNTHASGMEYQNKTPSMPDTKKQESIPSMNKNTNIPNTNTNTNLNNNTNNLGQPNQNRTKP